MDSEVGKEFSDFCVAHFTGMATIVEPDEANDPMDVGLLSPEAEVAKSDGFSDSIEEGRFAFRRGAAQRSGTSIDGSPVFHPGPVDLRVESRIFYAFLRSTGPFGSFGAA